MASLPLSESPNIYNNCESPAASANPVNKETRFLLHQSDHNKENSSDHHIETPMDETRHQRLNSVSASQSEKEPTPATHINVLDRSSGTEKTDSGTYLHGRGQVTLQSNSKSEDRLPNIPTPLDSTSTETSPTYFDPNQTTDERRRVRKALRDLNKEVQGSQTELLAPGSTGIQDIISRANEYFHSVRQTSDATIDSRLLVTAGDLTYKKTSQVVLGDGSQGIDVNEFVSKCVTFMRPRVFVQHRGSNQALDLESEVEGVPGSGDALKWGVLGMQACILRNSRPPTPSFLLGPLSVRKRLKMTRSRREKLRQAAPIEAMRPDEIKAVDMVNTVKSDVKSVCTKIHNRLRGIISDGQAKVEESYSETMSGEEYRDLLDQHDLASNGGVPLFRFILHPTSFGQSVENMFYLSFLVKDGALGVDSDDTGMPVLHIASDNHGQYTQSIDEDDLANRNKIKKHQAVLKLDYEMWEDLVMLLGIKKCLIPDRAADEAALHVGTNQWYG